MLRLPTRGVEIITIIDFPPYWQNVQNTATTCEGIARANPSSFQKKIDVVEKPWNWTSL